MLEFKVLGPLRVLVDGEDVPVDDPVDRALLAGLLLNPNRTVSPIALVREHWPRTSLPRRIAARTVESADRLQRFIDALPGMTRLLRGQNGYLLEVDEGLIDRIQAEMLLDEARTSSFERRVDALRQAYGLWLETANDEVAVQSPYLSNLRRRVVSEWVTAQRAIGLNDEVIRSGLVARDWEALLRSRFVATDLRPEPENPRLAGRHLVVLWDDPEEPSTETSRPLETPSSGGGGVLTATDTMAVSMYLSDEGPHTAVEAAVEAVLAGAGLAVVERDDPILGSWFRRVRASELGAVAMHAADSRLVLAHDAQVTSTMMANLGPVLTALQPVKEAVVRLGAVLIVKLDDQLFVHQLTAAQQLQLDHQPQLAMAPREILSALRLPDVPSTSVVEGTSG